MAEKINTSKAPAAIGPYSQGVRSGNFLFTSGQIPLSAETGEVIGTEITEQTKQVLQNLKAVLEAGRLILLQQIADFRQKLHIGRRSSRGFRNFFFFSFKLIHGLQQHENSKRDNQEVKNDLNKVSIA